MGEAFRSSKGLLDDGSRINRTDCKAAAWLRSVEASAARLRDDSVRADRHAAVVAGLHAFTSKNGAFTLDNFHRLVSDAAYLDPLLTTFALATLSALICCVVAAPMGWLVARTDMPLRRTIRLLVTASFVTPPFLGAIAWELLAAPNSG